MRGPYGAVVNYADFDLSQIIRQNLAFGVDQAATPAAGVPSQIVLFNPAGAPTVAHFYQFNVIASGGAAIDIYGLNADPGFAAGNTPQCLNIGGAGAPHVIVESAAAALAANIGRIARLGSGAVFSQGFGGQEICRCVPGAGILLAGATNNAALELSIFWAEF